MKEKLYALLFGVLILTCIDIILYGQLYSQQAPLGAQDTQFSISNLSEVPPSNTIEVPLVGSWSLYNGECYGGATVLKQGSLCFAQGLIKGNDWNSQLISLPEGYRPQKTLVFGLNSGTHCRVNLWTQGGAAWSAGAKGDWVSLSGMIYSPTQLGTPIPLNTNYWVSFRGADGKGAGYATPAWIKEGNIIALTGIAELTGSWDAVNRGNPYDENNFGGRLIGQLPEGARPTKRLIFICDNHGHANRVDVLPNGKIVLTSEGSGEAWMSLNNIAFSTVEGTPLQLAQGCTMYDPLEHPNKDHNWGVPSAIKQGNICMLQGVVKLSKSSRSFMVPIAYLPPEMCPARRLIFNGMGAQRLGYIELKFATLYWSGSSDVFDDWVNLSNIVYTVPTQPLGGKNFMCVDRSSEPSAYHENWKFGMPGQGWVKFKARGMQNISLPSHQLQQILHGNRIL